MDRTDDDMIQDDDNESVVTEIVNMNKDVEESLLEDTPQPPIIHVPSTRVVPQPKKSIPIRKIYINSRIPRRTDLC